MVVVVHSGVGKERTVQQTEVEKKGEKRRKKKKKQTSTKGKSVLGIVKRKESRKAQILLTR